MLAIRCLALSEDDRWERYWNALYYGHIELPTSCRMPEPTVPDIGHIRPHVHRIPA